jgi:hypothetical protein
MSLATTQSPELQRHRRVKFIRFIICQIIALSIVAGSAALGISPWFTDESLRLTFTWLTIAGAIAAVAIPIVFYALPATLPRS